MSKHIETGAPQAMIIPFPRRGKRGRPPLRKPSTDTGTPELVMKRLKGETTEALDLCLERGIITPEQHWCGIHFRWLYTLRHGAPGVRALDPTHMGGIDIKNDDPEWRASREGEYHAAMVRLKASGHAACLSNLCIHNERPGFLTHPRRAGASAALDRIRTGLDILAAHWKR